MIRTKHPFTFIEVMIVASILAVALMTAMLFIANQHTFSQLGQEKKFGYEKAMQILNEIKTFQETSTEEGDLIYLDDLGDGTGTNHLLTIQLDITDPADPMSSNVLIGTDPNDPMDWKYCRRVYVQKYYNTNVKDVRKVGVQVFLTAKDTPSNGDEPDHILLSEVWTVIQTAADPAFPPTQTYDLYAIAIENVPGWWVYMNNLVPHVENGIRDMESRQPGLNFNVHWITKMGYGRNTFYQPVFNVDSDSVTATFDSPYFYPSLMPDGSATSEYYVPSMVKGWYRDESDNNYNGYNGDSDDAAYNPFPYTIADNYNHSMRYPEMLGLYAKRLAANADEEMPYALLLDDMHLNPEKYRNALFVNLHGELLPLPVIRNYADAAKHPLVSNIEMGTLDRVVAEASHSYLRSAIGATTNQVYVSQINNLSDDDDFVAGDYVRIGSEICLITAVDTANRTLTLSRGSAGTAAANHPMLSPIIHQPFMLFGLGNNAAYKEIAINNTKGLEVGEQLSAIGPTGPVLIGEIIALNSAATPTPTVTVDNRDDSLAWAALTQVICSSAVPTLSADITAGTTSPSYHNGGDTSPIATNNFLNIRGELLQQTAASTTRGLYSSTAVAHNMGEVVGHAFFADAVRVVAHPENIRYDIDEDPAFRIYGWLSNSAPDADVPSRLSTMPITSIIPIRTLTLDDANTDEWIQLRDSIITSLTGLGITKIEGGALPSGSRYGDDNTITNYTLANDALTSGDDEMYARVDPLFIRTSADGIDPPTGTLAIAIRLYNTPLVTTQVSNQGLNSGAELYGLDYLPTPFNGDFTANLTALGNGRKNTARWIVPFPDLTSVLNNKPTDLLDSEVAALYAPLSIQTRIGDIVTQSTSYSGTTVNELVVGSRLGEFTSIEHFKDPHSWSARTENFTQTHTWSHDTTDLTLAEDPDVPFSDKYQFIGDPRYEPCADVLNAGHHNPFFTDQDMAGEGMGTTYQGWGDDTIEFDVPRLMQMLRNAIMGSNAFFTTINGYSYFYVGLGGEIGYDSANGFEYSIPVNGTPYDQNGSGYAQHITDGGGAPSLGGQGFNLIGHATATSWCAAPSLGELYRDGDRAIWQNGLDLDDYHRIDKASYSAVPAAQRYYSGRRTSEKGCKSFYNLSNDGSTSFDHDFNEKDSFLLPTTTDTTNIKDDIEDMFNLILPETVLSYRPWRMNSSNSRAVDWNFADNAADRNQGNILQVFYEHTDFAVDGSSDPISGIASGLLQVFDPDDNSRHGYFGVHGISKTDEIGSVFIGRFAIMSLLYSYHRAAATDNPIAPVEPLPRVEITAPTDMTALINPGVVSVHWYVKWERYDEMAYTDVGTHDINRSPDADGFFKLAYSSDNRETWRYLNSTVPYEAGEPDDGGVEISADITVAADPILGGFLSADPDSSANKTRWNYSIPWDLSGFPKGTYHLRVEYHRRDSATGYIIPTHHSLHVMAINVEE